jgi:hypothetical protein
MDNFNLLEFVIKIIILRLAFETCNSNNYIYKTAQFCTSILRQHLSL